MDKMTIKNFHSVEEFRDYLKKHGEGNDYSLSQLVVIYNFLSKNRPDTVIDPWDICKEFTPFHSADEAVKALEYEDILDLQTDVDLHYAPNGEVLVQWP